MISVPYETQIWVHARGPELMYSWNAASSTAWSHLFPERMETGGRPEEGREREYTEKKKKNRLSLKV